MYIDKRNGKTVLVVQQLAVTKHVR